MEGKGQPRFRVIDALDHPHGGRILRMRLAAGDPPTVRALRGARLRAWSPGGEERELRVLGLPVFQGKVTDRRLRETGRVDVVVEQEGSGTPVDITWEVTPA